MTNSAPLTEKLNRGTWKLFKGLVKSDNDRFLSLAGPTILIFTIASWIIFFWLGWVLIFYAQPDSILVKSTKATPEFSGFVWYIAYTIFTVGNGDFSPQGNLWQILSGFVAFSGLGLATLSFTYIIQVVAAVANKRALASQITSTALSAEEFVLRQWSGKDFGAIALQLSALNQQFATVTEQHLSYPILHYYHAARKEKSLNVAVAIFDEALTIIRFAVDKKQQPDTTVLYSARQAVSSYLNTVKMAYIQSAPESPAEPDLSSLSKAGIPVSKQEEFSEKLKEEADERRKQALGLIRQGAWQWPNRGKHAD